MSTHVPKSWKAFIDPTPSNSLTKSLSDLRPQLEQTCLLLSQQYRVILIPPPRAAPPTTHSRRRRRRRSIHYQSGRGRARGAPFYRICGKEERRISLSKESRHFQCSARYCLPLPLCRHRRAEGVGSSIKGKQLLVQRDPSSQPQRFVKCVLRSYGRKTFLARAVGQWQYLPTSRQNCQGNILRCD